MPDAPKRLRSAFLSSPMPVMPKRQDRDGDIDELRTLATASEGAMLLQSLVPVSLFLVLGFARLPAGPVAPPAAAMGQETFGLRALLRGEATERVGVEQQLREESRRSGKLAPELKEPRAIDWVILGRSQPIAGPAQRLAVCGQEPCASAMTQDCCTC